LATLTALLEQEFEVYTAGSAEAALQILDRQAIDLVLTDQKMPHMSGVELLQEVRNRRPKAIRLLMTGFGELEDAVAAINRGQVYRYLFKPWRADELLAILRDACRTFLLEQHNEQLLEELRMLNMELEQRVQDRTGRLEEANRELQLKNQMLERLALTDPLTGLPNRRAFDRLAEAEIRRRSRYPSTMAMGLIDLDHFKDINRIYLHPGGDQVLTDLSKILLASIRTVDTVGRVGGEEFMVLAPETNHEGAAILAERIRAAVELGTFIYKNVMIPVTASVGFAVVQTGVPTDYDQLKHSAAAALGEAKASGRNCCVVHSVSPVLA
jgi:diguanylate cyclase (GGDEF)-like protein